MSRVPDFIVSEWVRTNKAENSGVYSRAVIQINKWVGWFKSSLQDFLKVKYYKNVCAQCLRQILINYIYIYTSTTTYIWKYLKAVNYNYKLVCFG